MTAEDRRFVIAAIACFLVIGLVGKCDREAEEQLFNEERGMARVSLYPYSADPPNGAYGERRSGLTVGLSPHETKVGSAEVGR